MLMTGGGTPPRSKKIIHEAQNDNYASNIDIEMGMIKANNGEVSLALLAEHLDSKMSMVEIAEQGEECGYQQQNTQNIFANNSKILY